MSEVSLEAAHGSYKEWAASDSLEDLYDGIVRGQAQYGFKITHIYCFIDDLKDIQLFYCRDGNHEDLLTSRHVHRLKLLWESGQTYAAPRYLKRAYNEILGYPAPRKVLPKAVAPGKKTVEGLFYFLIFLLFVAFSITLFYIVWIDPLGHLNLLVKLFLSIYVIPIAVLIAFLMSFVLAGIVESIGRKLKKPR